MPETSEETNKREAIEEIMRAVYGHFLDWKKPIIDDHFGPHFPDVFDEFETELKEAISNSLSDLREQSVKQLHINFKLDPFNPKPALSLGNDDHSSVLRNLPAWFLGGLGNRDKIADFKHWSRVGHFTHIEAACVTLGFEPDNYDQVIFNRYSDYHVVRYFQRHLNLIERRFDPESHSRIERLEFLAWIADFRIDLHPEFQIELDKLKKDRTVERPDKNHRALSRVEKESLLKIIAAMAVKGYVFDPKMSRNTATADIRNDMDQLGLGIDDKTLLKWLREACDLIPDTDT